MAGVFIFVLSGCDAPEFLILALILGGIAVGAGCGAAEIENENTTLTTEVVRMEVTDKDIGNDNFYITVGNKYLINVEANEYAKLDKGDAVLVQITTKTKFVEAKKPMVTLKGTN